MPTRRSVDIALAAVLTPIWLACLALHVEGLAQDRIAWLPIYAVPAADNASYPTLRAYWPDAPPELRTLEPGDELRSLAGHDLRGAGRFAVLATALDRAGDSHEMTAVVQRDALAVAAQLHLLPHSFPWRTIPLTVGLGLASIFALARGRGRRSARAFALGAISYSFVWLLQLGGPPWKTALALFLLAVPGSLFLPLTLRAALEIPEAPTRSPRWRREFVWLFALAGPLLTSWIVDYPFPGDVAVRWLVATYGAFTITLFTILAIRFRSADPKGRRQLKWVALGFYVGLAPAIVTSALTAVRPELRWLYEISLVTTPLIPVCILIGIIRDSFLDIDRILTLTCAYSLSAPALIGLLLSIGPVAAESISRHTGIGYTTALWILAVAVAAPGAPLARTARPWLERIIARDQLRTQERLRALRAELRGDEGPGPLLRSLGKGLAEVLDLDQAAIYAVADRAYVPVFAQGPLVPPGLPAEGSLVKLLCAAQGPIDRETWLRWKRTGALDAPDAAVLETLGARAVLPLRRGDELMAFAVLGEKVSGDLFSTTDIASLESLAERSSAELERYHHERFAEQLRDYVPDPVARELARGVDLDQGEIEVSILFVDIRGYTTISQSRSARDVFAITSQYTTAVSGDIDDHGGVVVEFQGDGLMAVFGAPEPFQDKEDRALAAGRAILRTLQTDRFGDLPAGSLEAGVGIATGLAFVGNIQAAGQKVWSVMGNSTNFAARLEALTRNLDASIVIDDTTRNRVSADVSDFDRFEGIEIKGRSETFCVYARPRDRIDA